MQFSQDHKENICTIFKKNTSINQIFWQKAKNPMIEERLDFFPKMRIFRKNLASSVFETQDSLTSCKLT